MSLSREVLTTFFCAIKESYSPASTKCLLNASAPWGVIFVNLLKLIAVPFLPYLPLLPILWIYVSLLRGKSKLITSSTDGISIPRAAISVATSMVTLVGMFYGAKKYNLIKRVLKHCIKYALIVSIIFSMIFYFLSDRILSVFINDQNVIDIGVGYFNIFSFAIPFITLTMISSRVIQGLGKSYPMFIITCLRVIIISCSLGWYFIVIDNKPLGYAWIAILISCIIAAIISFIWLIFELRKLKIS